MPNALLRDLIETAGKRMAVDLDERLVPHRGEQGASREESIRQFLRAHLPKRFEVGQGFIFDANGDVSPQIDLIIADSTVTPRFETGGGISFYHCEGVVAAGEVKTKLTSKKELWEVFQELRTVSRLDRSAGGRAVCERTRDVLDPETNHLHRIFTFVLVLDRALSPEAMQEEMFELVHCADVSEWPNMIFAFKRFLLTFCCENGPCPNTLDARGIAVSKTGSEADLLILFYIYLYQACSVTRVATAESFSYLRDLADVRWDVLYSSSGSPDDGALPPFLGSLRMHEWKNPYAKGDQLVSRSDPASGRSTRLPE